MNKGGFSWKRLFGITGAKQRLSRQIGIPLTKSGRERKLGAMITGNDCLVLIIANDVLSALLFYII